MWLLKSGRCIAVLRHAHGSIHWLKFDETSLCLVSAGDGGECIVWDIGQYIIDSPASWKEVAMDLTTSISQPSFSQESLVTAPSEVDVEDSHVDATNESDNTYPRFSRIVSEYKKGDIPMMDIMEEDGAHMWRDARTDTMTSISSSNGHLCGDDFPSGVSNIDIEGGQQGNRHPPDYQHVFLNCPWLCSDTVVGSDSLKKLGENSSKNLALPHISDGALSSRSSSSHSKDSATAVYCLDISPLGNHIVTGCEDGVARLWCLSSHDSLQEKLHAQNHNQTESSRNTRSSGAVKNTEEMLTMLASQKGVLPDDEWKSLETVAKHLVIRLEGHSMGVTDTKFSNSGERVVTGASKEGIIRIWSFNKSYSKAVPIVIHLESNCVLFGHGGNEDGGSGTNDAPGGRRQNYHSRRLNNNANKNVNKTMLYNVHWTCDDRFILTLQSAPDVKLHGVNKRSNNDDDNPNVVGGSRIKIWNTDSGTIVSTVLVSYERNDVLSIHPTNPYIFCTAGMDGVLRVWDSRKLDDASINPGDKKPEQYTQDVLPFPPQYDFSMRCPPDIGDIPEGAPIRIVDAMFSADCYRIICSDFIGRISLFGLQCEDSSRFEGVLSEQYFSNDYADIVLDDDGWAFDVSLLKLLFTCVIMVFKKNY